MAREEVKIEQIAAGISDRARPGLVTLFDQLFTTLDNLDVLCRHERPPCGDYMHFEQLKRLHGILWEHEHRGGPSRPPPLQD